MFQPSLLRALPAIQLLKAIGFTRIIVYASSRHFALLQTFGATDLIDRLQTPITSVPPIVKSLSTDPLTAIYDTIGDAECQQAASDCLSPGGTFVTVMPENVKQDEGKHVIFVAGTLSWPSHKDFGQIIVSKITGWFEEGVIVVCGFSKAGIEVDGLVAKSIRSPAWRFERCRGWIGEVV